jgi:ribose transport system substrate-binding protein
MSRREPNPEEVPPVFPPIPFKSRTGRWRFLLAASLTLAVAVLAACGGGGGGGGGKKSLTLIAGVKGDEFYITMNCGAQAEARKQGASLNFQGPNEFSSDLQTPIVNAVAAKKPDAVLVAPTDTKAMYAPIKALADGGSKVVFVDTTLDNASLAVSQIASDNIGGGRAAAKTLAKLIGGKGKVFVNNVKPGISTTDLRAKGFQEGAKAAGLQYIGLQYNQDDPAKAASITKSILARNPDLKGIFATNLFGAEGAASGLKEAGMLGKVKIVGFDAGPKQVQDLKQGLVQGLIAQRPAQIGALGVQQAVAALDGKPTKKKIATGSVSITKDNLGQNQNALYKARC